VPAYVDRVSTPQGPARVTRYPAPDAWVRVLLSHGAGGGIEACDLVAAAARLPAEGVEVLLVEQPWRVGGRRMAPPPDRLDEAVSAVVAQVAPAAPFVVGGRSAGARVACRIGAALGAAGVLALAFPLQPPGRPDRPARTAELAGCRLPVLVVQGARDAFGSAGDVRAALALCGPEQEAGVRIVEVPGADHGFAVRAVDGGTTVRDARLAAALREVRTFLGLVAGREPAGNI